MAWSNTGLAVIPRLIWKVAAAAEVQGFRSNAGHVSRRGSGKGKRYDPLDRRAPDVPRARRTPFGGHLNFLRTWDTLEDLDAAGYRGWVTIQSKDKASPHFVPCAHTILGRMMLRADGTGLDIFDSVETAVRGLIYRGAPKSRMYFREIPAPDTRRVIQFEAMLGPQWLGAGAGVELFYELDSVLPVRGIRERCQTASGLTAQRLLRSKLSPASYDTLMDIWDQYPEAIIEASEFSETCGVFRRPLVAWEVRDF